MLKFHLNASENFVRKTDVYLYVLEDLLNLIYQQFFIRSCAKHESEINKIIQVTDPKLELNKETKLDIQNKDWMIGDGEYLKKKILKPIQIYTHQFYNEYIDILD